METLILDVSKWICGSPHKLFSPSENALGKGETYLQNNFDFNCCLGQFMYQMFPDIEAEDLQDVPYPSEVEGIDSDTLFIEFKQLHGKTHKFDSQFTIDCIKINDDLTTTVKKKIELLTSKCKEYGIELKVINYADNTSD